MLKRFSHSQDGAVMVEAAIAMTLLLVLTLGFVDFGNALYQWNSASKAVQAGARLAAISDPVATGLANAAPTTTPGAPVAPGGYKPFICTSTGCTQDGSPSGWSATAFNQIFQGDMPLDASVRCPPLTAGKRPGMCHFYPMLQRSNVVITYSATGLGYQTRLGGPIPTITVSLQGVSFQFFFLEGLLGFTNIAMPSMLSTVTGEDLKSGAS
jgi:Flp pilus assembly protein TadG